jgi:hypothetical protein
MAWQLCFKHHCYTVYKKLFITASAPSLTLAYSASVTTLMTITSYSSGIVLDTTDAEFSAVCDNADAALRSALKFQEFLISAFSFNQLRLTNCYCIISGV